jgi:hypothetical protein
LKKSSKRRHKNPSPKIEKGFAGRKQRLFGEIPALFSQATKEISGIYLAGSRHQRVRNRIYIVLK